MFRGLPGDNVENNHSAQADSDTVQDVSATLAHIHERLTRIRTGLANTIVGQDEVVEQLLIAMLAGGHCILVGVPGLAKTLLISSLARLIDLQFGRVQFTPDLMPADITGTEVIQEDQATGMREFRFVPGPIFANVILADEVNRTPPKTQAALLEAMQERQVTSGGRKHDLPQPFFVLATQNPIEQEGTYPLPEAQLDRFMFMVQVAYPTQEEELEIVLRTTGEPRESLPAAITGDEFSEMIAVVRRIAIPPNLALVATEIARLTRPNRETTPDNDAKKHSVPALINSWVRWGAGPRASQYIVLAAKARAAMFGSPMVRREDINAVALPVLRHRIKLNFQAESEGITVESVIDHVLEHVDASIQGSANREQIAKILRS
ncbi:MAG: AAA family ATPase [Planctomycetota bacterium]